MFHTLSNGFLSRATQLSWQCNTQEVRQPATVKWSQPQKTGTKMEKRKHPPTKNKNESGKIELLNSPC